MACCHDPRCPTSEPPYDEYPRLVNVGSGTGFGEAYWEGYWDAWPRAHSFSSIDGGETWAEIYPNGCPILSEEHDGR